MEIYITKFKYIKIVIKSTSSTLVWYKGLGLIGWTMVEDFGSIVIFGIELRVRCWYEMNVRLAKVASTIFLLYLSRIKIDEDEIKFNKQLRIGR